MVLLRFICCSELRIHALCFLLLPEIDDVLIRAPPPPPSPSTTSFASAAAPLQEDAIAKLEAFMAPSLLTQEAPAAETTPDLACRSAPETASEAKFDLAALIRLPSATVSTASDLARCSCSDALELRNAALLLRR
jgi:hypothetical protein